MLNIFNKLRPFFRDNYVELSIREYAKLSKVSPPTAGKILNNYTKEGLLNKNQERNMHLFSANRSSKLFEELQKLFYFSLLEQSGFLDFIEQNYYPEKVILFGSAIKAELTKESDLDLILISKLKKEINLSYFEKKFRRNIQLFVYSNLTKIPENLRKNIKRGFIVYGKIN